MTSMTRRGLPTILLAVALGACGGGAAPRQAAAPVAQVAQVAPVASASPVAVAPEPARAVEPDVWISVPRPSRSLARVRPLLAGMPEANAALEAALSKARPFDLEAPVTYAMKGQAQVMSFGVTAEVAEALRKTPDEHCTVFAHGGAARFGCVTGGPFDPDLVRFVPATSVTSDVHFEGTAAGFAELSRAKKADDGSPADAKVEEDAKALLAVATMLDVQRFAIDVTLDPNPQVRVALRTGGGQEGATLLGAPVAPPPSGFAALPEDAELALFAHAPSAESMRRLREMFFGWVELADPPACARIWRAERKELERLLFTGGSVVVAAGVDRAPLERASEALVAAPKDKKRLEAMRSAAGGWAVVGLEESAAGWQAGFEALEKLSCPDRNPVRPPEKVVVSRNLPAQLGLPPGTLEITSTRPASDMFPANRRVILVAPDRNGGGKERTWIAFAGDTNVARAKLRRVLAGRPARARRADLESPASVGASLTPLGAAWLAAGDSGKVATLAPLAAKVLALRARESGRPGPAILLKGAPEREGVGGSLAVRFSLPPAALAAIAPSL